MRVGWLRVAVLGLAVVLGVTGGMAAALIVHEQQNPPTEAQSPTPEPRNPLNLGADLVNLDCTEDTILIVGHGRTAPALQAAVVENDGAKYLETAESCPTLYAPVGQQRPEYVVYLGPYRTPAASCEIRMTADHKGHYVTRLREGNEMWVKCPCELSADTAPVLEPGVTHDLQSRIWVRSLQGMLLDLERLTDDQVTGRYGRPTVDAVKEMQRAFSLDADGIVNADTWRVIRDRACQLYDY